MSPSSPPPRKPPKRQRRSQKRDVVADALRELEADPETSGPHQIADALDPLDGEWLYKENDVVRGPMSAERLLQSARDGAMANDTPIAREVGQWRPLHSVSVFADAWEDGAESRVEAAKLAAMEKKRTRMKGMRVVLVAMLFVIPFSACAVVSRTVVAARPWDDSDTWRKKAPPLIEIPKKVVDKPVRVAVASTKKVEKPEDTTTDGTDTATETTSKKSTDATSGRRSRRRGGKSKAAKAEEAKRAAAKKEADAKKTKKAEAKKVAAVKKAKVAEKLTDKQVNSGLKRGIKRIGACLKAETERNDAMPAAVTVAFSINNAGKAIQVKVLERQVRKGPLTPCMKKAIGRISWPKTYGENRYVEVPFRIKKRRK